MSSMDGLMVEKMVQDINGYLDCKQQADFLWYQVDMHLQTSYLAESLGDRELIPKHLSAVAGLLLEANRMQQQVNTHLSRPFAFCQTTFWPQQDNAPSTNPMP